jgi:hypothetical protein
MAVAHANVRAQLRFDHLTYLTGNLDSLTKSFQHRGYRVLPGVSEPFGLQTNYVIIEDGSFFELRSTASNDPEDLLVTSLAKYGDHITGLAFRCADLLSIREPLVRSGIKLTGIMDGVTRYPTKGSRGIAIPRDAYWEAFALEGTQPLDIVFVRYADSARTPLDVYRRLAPEIAMIAANDSLTHHENHVYRVDWLLLAASHESEQQLRRVFASLVASPALGVRTGREGCCDYWMLGLAADRTKFRFDPPPDKAKNEKYWLSIEDAGVIAAF